MGSAYAPMMACLPGWCTRWPPCMPEKGVYPFCGQFQGWSLCPSLPPPHKSTHLCLCPCLPLGPQGGLLPSPPQRRVIDPGGAMASHQDILFYRGHNPLVVATGMSMESPLRERINPRYSMVSECHSHLAGFRKSPCLWSCWSSLQTCSVCCFGSSE